MDAKELKTTLKNAREAIRNKEFKDALKHCKAILASDGNHYMALVLVAVAAEGLEQFDQALKAYKRAITADESQVLAWQGLASFCEKNPSADNYADLTDAYLRLVQFHNQDKDKRHDVVCKLVQLKGVQKSDRGICDKIIEVCQTVLEEEPTGEAKITVMRSLIPLILGTQRDDRESQVQQLSEELLSTKPSFDDSLEIILKAYLDILAKQRIDKLQETCSALYQKYPDSLICLEYVVVCILDKHIGLKQFSLGADEEEKLGAYESRLGEEGNQVLSVVMGYRCLIKREWLPAQQYFKQAMDQSTSLVCLYVYQSMASLHLHQNEAALFSCDQGLKVANKKNRLLTVPCIEVVHILHLIKVMSLYATGDKKSLSAAMEIINSELSSDHEEIRVWQGLLYLKQGDMENAKNCVVGESVHRYVLEGLIAKQEDKPQEAAAKFEHALTLDPQTSDHHVHLAKCLWTQDPKRAFTLLLKAAKLDPYASVTFMYLGHYYNKVAKDSNRARKCYQKSYDLDPKNEETGEALCDLLNEAGAEAQSHKMLLEVTSQGTPGSCKWAWLRLGLHQVKQEEPTIAIASFQSALRADPADNHVWECLGEAYVARGSYTAALKAFNRASELSPGSIYCLYQMASIKQTLCSYTEAIEEYKEILVTAPNYVPALKGLGESYYLSAKSLLTKCFHGRARDTAQLAVSHLWKAVSSRPDLSCLWKLMGDSFTILHVLPADNFRFEKPDNTVLSKLETLELGGRCYAKALKLLPECSSLWHDLGLNYFHQSKVSSEDAVISLAEKGVAALKKAIQLEPTNHRHWTALGYVSCFEKCFKPELAQHSFIKSIELEKNNVVAWTNLAALYLKHENIKLAHEAFKIAQSLEPSYVACWIGQAIIAELVGHEEAMDLFRHTTELGNHVESALGYGHWVCQMVLKREDHDSYVFYYAIEQMAAIPTASDALAKYTDRVKTNPIAYNLYGLLLERQKLYKTAAKQFEHAIPLLEKDPSTSEGLCIEVRSNYARLLCKSGDYLKSIEIYEKLPVDNFSCADLCQMGLSYYKAGNLEKAFLAYTQASEKAKTVAEKSHVLVAVAMVTYKYGDQNGTKTTLFQGSQLSDPSPQGLKALCALGLIQSDVTLATAAIQELFKLEGSNAHLRDTLLLSVMLEILQGNLIVAKRMIQRHIHMYPGQAELWKLLSSMLLRYFPTLGGVVCQTAGSAMLLQTPCKQEEYPLVTAGELSQGFHGNGSNNAFLSAQRAIRLHPELVESWGLLASALHAESVLTVDWKRRSALLQAEYNTLRYIQASESASLELKLWCCKQEIVCLVHSGREGEVIDTLDKLLTEFGSEADVKALFDVFRNVLQGSQDGLSSCLTDTSSLYYWQILFEMMVTAGLHTEVVHTLHQCIARSSSPEDQLSVLMKLAFVLYQSRGSDGDGQQKLFDECIDQILSLDPSNTAAFLMQGCMSLQVNIRSAKHHLQKVSSHVTQSRGHDLSVARRALIYVLNKTKKDPDMLEHLVEEAKQQGDETTLTYYDRIIEQS